MHTFVFLCINVVQPLCVFKWLLIAEKNLRPVMAGNMCRYDLYLMCPESDAVQHKLDQGPESYIKESISRNLEIKLIYTTEQKVTHGPRKQTRAFRWGEEHWGGTRQGDGIKRNVLVRINQINNKDILQNTRNFLKKVNIQTSESVHKIFMSSLTGKPQSKALPWSFSLEKGRLVQGLE